MMLSRFRNCLSFRTKRWGYLASVLSSAGLLAVALAGCGPAPMEGGSRAVSVADAGTRITNSLHMTLVAIPVGSFVMGSPPDEPDRFPNETPHHVRITRPFWLATTTVTVRQFAAFVGQSGYQTTAEREGWANGAWNVAENRWERLSGASWRNPGFAQTDDHPVVSVSWDDANEFCRWLGAQEGRRYRLPTEAEWEYACRAGTQTAYPWGRQPAGGFGWANGDDQAGKDRFTLFPPFPWNDGYVFTAPVGHFQANAWGLHDMIGNVLQWCSDWYGDYPNGDVEDPAGPRSGAQRILRGGAFVYGPRHCRSAFRGRNDPDFRNFYIGFRVALTAEPSGHGR